MFFEYFISLSIHIRFIYTEETVTKEKLHPFSNTQLGRSVFLSHIFYIVSVVYRHNVNGGLHYLIRQRGMGSNNCVRYLDMHKAYIKVIALIYLT